MRFNLFDGETSVDLDLDGLEGGVMNLVVLLLWSDPSSTGDLQRV